MSAESRALDVRASQKRPGVAGSLYGACALLALMASCACGVPARDMLLGQYDCDAYGGDESLAVYGQDVTVYPGSGDVVLHFRRHELQAASNTEDVVVHKVLGEELDATSLGEDVVIRLSLEGSMPVGASSLSSGAGGDGSPAVRSPFETVRDPRYWVPEIPGDGRLTYTDVYPGIDFWYFDDTARREFDFIARPGASLSNVVLRVDGADPGVVDAEGNLVFLLRGGKVVLGQPRLYESASAFVSSEHELGTPLEESWGSYDAGGGVVRLGSDTAAPAETPAGYNGAAARPEPEVRLVSAAGDTHGPAYDFYVGAFEVTNGEWVDFLNSAEANATNLLGTNLYFDAQGNVWINPLMKPNRDEVFSVAESRIVYRADRPLGERYAISDRVPAYGESYTNHPATGGSWFGAVKYCNWLTLATGRGADQLCYREGTNAWDWAPVTCARSNWVAGVFTSAERIEWLGRRGFRLMMDGCSGTNGHSAAFSEFYKAGTWTGSTNVQYGFGRTNAVPGDANFRRTAGAEKPDTTPVGFFDGTDHGGTAPTRTNENAYGIYDLSGNVDEWVNDPGITNSLVFRGFYGGSWFSPLPTLSARGYARPSDTRGSRGLRVATSYDAGGRLAIVRIPYYACLCPFQRTAGELAGEAARKAEGEEDGTQREWNVLETDTSQTPGTQSGVIKKEEGEGAVVPAPGPVGPSGGGVPSGEISGEVSPI